MEDWLVQRRRETDGKRYRPEETVSKLRAAEFLLVEGINTGEVVRRLGGTQMTY